MLGFLKNGTVSFMTLQLPASFRTLQFLIAVKFEWFHCITKILPHCVYVTAYSSDTVCSGFALYVLVLKSVLTDTYSILSGGEYDSTTYFTVSLFSMYFLYSSLKIMKQGLKDKFNEIQFVENSGLILFLFLLKT